MKSRQKEIGLEDAIIDLYLGIKQEEHLDKYNEKMAQQDRDKLKKLDSLIVIDYIKTSMEILVNIKVKRHIEEFMKEIENKNYHSNSLNEYEELLRQSEANVRNHIRIQHQLKLHTENLKYRIEELERSKSELKKVVKSLQEQLLQVSKAKADNESIDKKEKEIKNLTSELENMKTILTSYETQNLKITEMEMKLRSQNIKHEKEIKSMEEKSKEEISYLNKIISSYEDVLKVRNISQQQKTQNGGHQNNFSQRDSLKDYNNRGKNYIEEEEEISHFHYERQNLQSGSKSSSMRRTPSQGRDEFISNSDKIQSKIESYKKLIENRMGDMNKDYKESGRNSSIKAAMRRNHSNEFNEDFVRGLKPSPEKSNPLTISDQNAKVIMNKLNLTNLSKLNNGSSHTDRSSSAHKSNYGSQNSHRSRDVLHNYGSNNQRSKDCSPKFSPEIKINKQPNNDVNIRDYIYAKLNKSKSNSKLTSNVTGHVRSKSGYTLNYY